MNKQDEELIKIIRTGDRTAMGEFILKFEKDVLNVISRPIIYKGSKFSFFAETEADLTSKKEYSFKLLEKAIEKLREGAEIKTNLRGWLLSLARNDCIDKYRNMNTGKKKKTRQPVEGGQRIKIYRKAGTILKDGDHWINAHGSKEDLGETEESKITFYYKKEIPDSIKAGIDRSVGYVALLCNAKKKVKGQLEKPMEILATLESSQKRLYRILGRRIEDRIQKYLDKKKEFQGLNRLLAEKERKELETLGRDWEAWRAFIAIKDLIIQEKDTINFYIGDACSMLSLIIPWADDEKFYKPFSNWRISPPRLLYEIWAKAKELQKGEYTDLKKIKLIFAYHKIKTKGTDKQFLFDILKDDLSNFNNIRVSRYQKLTNKGFYNKIIKYIHKRSFVDKIDPDMNHHLFLMSLWDEARSESERDLLAPLFADLPYSEIPECLHEFKKKVDKKKPS